MGGLNSPLNVGAVDTPEIHPLIRNQVVRVGAKIGSKTLSYAGSSLIGHGVAQRSLPSPISRYESVTKRSVIAKGGTVQQGTKYLPPNSMPRQQNRQLHKHRYNRTAPVRGTRAINTGIALRGAGRLLPVLAWGSIGWDLYHGRNLGGQPTQLETMEGIGGSIVPESTTMWRDVRGMMDSNAAALAASVITAYNLASIVTNVGSSLMSDFI